MRIAVFRTGRHTDSHGHEKDWTESDLDKIAGGYDPKTHEAPVVIGHPKENAPAYGWVEGLEREGDTLFARIKPTVDEFAGWVKRGLWKKRSISLYPDLTLRHIGFLGAQPPAVKGLPDFQFDEKEDTVLFEFEEISEEERKELAKKGEALPDGSFPIRNKSDLENAVHAYGRAKDKEKAKRHIIRRAKALEATDQLPADWEGSTKKENKFMEGGAKMSFWEELKSFLKGKGVDVEGDSFAEDRVKEAAAEAIKKAKAEADAEFAERERGLKAREAQLEAKALEGRKREVAEFCEGLKKKGILTPAMEKAGMGITSFMQSISGMETAYEFAEAGEDGRKQKQTPFEFMRDFLSRLPAQINFAQVAKREDDQEEGDDETRRERAIRRHMKDNQMEDSPKNYKRAMLEVSKKRPELFEMERR